MNYPAVRNVKGMTFQAEDTGSEKALRQEQAWHVLVLKRDTQPVWLEQRRLVRT